jgi:hypothetical protein
LGAFFLPVWSRGGRGECPSNAPNTKGTGADAMHCLERNIRQKKLITERKILFARVVTRGCPGNALSTKSPWS